MRAPHIGSHNGPHNLDPLDRDQGLVEALGARTPPPEDAEPVYRLLAALAAQVDEPPTGQVDEPRTGQVDHPRAAYADEPPAGERPAGWLAMVVATEADPARARTRAAATAAARAIMSTVVGPEQRRPNPWPAHVRESVARRR